MNESGRRAGTQLLSVAETSGKDWKCMRATAELLTAPTKSPKSNCQSPQIAWCESRIIVQVLEAEEATLTPTGSFSLEVLAQTLTR